MGGAGNAIAAGYFEGWRDEHSLYRKGMQPGDSVVWGTTQRW